MKIFTLEFTVFSTFLYRLNILLYTESSNIGAVRPPFLGRRMTEEGRIFGAEEGRRRAGFLGRSRAGGVRRSEEE